MASELDLVQRVYDRIAAAATDEQLQEELNRYLAPVINKLSSNQEAVRTTVVEMLGHVNRRIKDHAHIQLPVEALLQQFSSSDATAFVVNFSLMYIKMGFPRLDGNKQYELIPVLFTAIESKPVHQDCLLVLVLRVLAQTPCATKLAADNSPLRVLLNKPALLKTFLDYMQDVLLLPYGSPQRTLQDLISHQQELLSRRQQQQNQSRNAQEQSLEDQAMEEDAHDDVPVPLVPAAMSINSYVRVLSNQSSRGEELEHLKIAVVRILEAEILPVNSMVVAAVIASSDTRFSVANAGESLLRRLDTVIDWNNSAVISGLYLLFLGTLMPIESTAVEKFKNPANTRIRLKLLPCLLKSREAANYTPLAVKVFCECLWGSGSNNKLKQFGISYLHHIAFNANPAKLRPVGSVLFDGVVRVIDEEKSDSRLSSLAYGALAKLSLTLPELLLAHPTSELHYLHTLMEAMSHEVGDVLLAIQEALAMVAPVCKQLKESSQEQLCLMLSSHVQDDNPALRRTAVHYASSVFAPDHPASRFILLLATGDSQDDIRLEATRELYKAACGSSDAQPTYVSPSFVQMLRYIIARINDTPRTRWRDVANTSLPYPLPVLQETLLYLQHCLAVECGVSLVSGSNVSTVSSFRDGTLMWPDCPTVSKHVSVCIENYDGQEPEPFRQFLGLCELTADAWSAPALEAVVRVVSVAPHLLAQVYFERMEWLRRFLLRGGHAGQTAALLYGTVAGQITDKIQFERFVGGLRLSKEMRVEGQECCNLAVGYALAFAKLRTLRDEDVIEEDEWAFFDSSVLQLVHDLMNGETALQSSLVVAVGEIARFSALPVPVGDTSELGKDRESKCQGIKKVPNLVNIFLTLQNIYENTKLSSKFREQAIQTTGYICVGQPDCPIKIWILRSLLGLAEETSELEIHFSVGGALSDCVLGSDSSSSRNSWTDSEPVSQDRTTDESMETSHTALDTCTDESSSSGLMDVDGKGYVEGSLEWLLDQLLHHYVPKTKPSVRQASCLWLLTVLKRCRHRPDVVRHLCSIQEAFMSLLGDSNELVQDAASKGLGVVYECCGKDTRQKMVEALVHALTEGKSRVSNITSDTKLFDEGELGKTPTGGQLSTYRELCSLASDLNQPDLVYKFMNLANHNAIWNSRKGAAFGFGSLAAQAGTQLEPYLPRIVPKLYRYQFDPTPRIQQPMVQIWSSLVTDTHKTTLQHYDAILADLIVSLTNNLWRVRESACGALCELVRQHSVVPALPHLATLWPTLFKVSDDIKESVRESANKALQSLSKSSIKVCEAGGTDSQALLKTILPVLLTDGLLSTVSEVRRTSLDTIVKVCRGGGALIRPHLSTLVPALLEALAGLEHQALNYTAVRQVQEEDRERIDTLRVAASRSTPMMDTLNFVLQFVDSAEVLDEVVPGVLDVLKRSVGFTSRTAAAHVLETLTHTCPNLLEKHSGKILTALVNGLSDRNATLRKAFAGAIGTVVRVAKPSSVDKLLTKLQTWYLIKEEDSVRLSAGVAMRSMHRVSADVMKNHASLAMPLAFLAMHAPKNVDGDPTGSEVWEEVWQENTPGNEAGMRTYLDEILALCTTAAASNNWALKAQTGRALHALADKVGKNFTPAQTSSTVDLLLTTLQGRTWQGKENIVLALSTVAINTKAVLRECKVKDTSDLLINEIIKVLIRESGKEKKDYKLHALRALSSVLEEYEMDKFEAVFDICSPHIVFSSEGSASEINASGNEDNSELHKQETLKWDLHDEMFASLGRAWPSSVYKDTQEHYSVRIVELLASSIGKVPRKTQLTVITTLGKYWKRHYLLLACHSQFSCGGGQTEQESNAGLSSSTPLYDPLQETHFDSVILQSCKIFNYCLGISKYYSLRKEALKVLLYVAESTKGNPIILNKVTQQMMASVEEARRDAQPDIQHLAVEVHKIMLSVS